MVYFALSMRWDKRKTYGSTIRASPPRRTFLAASEWEDIGPGRKRERSKRWIVEITNEELIAALGPTNRVVIERGARAGARGRDDRLAAAGRHGGGGAGRLPRRNRHRARGCACRRIWSTDQILRQRGFSAGWRHRPGGSKSGEPPHRKEGRPTPGNPSCKGGVSSRRRRRSPRLASRSVPCC